MRKGTGELINSKAIKSDSLISRRRKPERRKPGYGDLPEHKTEQRLRPRLRSLLSRYFFSAWLSRAFSCALAPFS
jgi:hypothetical protein